MKVLLLSILLLTGCSGFAAKVQQASNDYQTVVAAINADIAITAPLVAEGCVELQKWAMLIRPFVPTSGKAQQYLGAANGALEGYCQNIPTNIGGTVVAVEQAVSQARAGYDAVRKG